MRSLDFQFENDRSSLRNDGRYAFSRRQEVLIIVRDSLAAIYTLLGVQYCGWRKRVFCRLKRIFGEVTIGVRAWVFLPILNTSFATHSLSSAEARAPIAY